MADMRDVIRGDVVFRTDHYPDEEYQKVDVLNRYFPYECYSYYQFKHDVAANLAPNTILEIGVWRGYGALSMLTGSPMATYTGYELPPDHGVYMWHQDCLEHARKILADFSVVIRLQSSQEVESLAPECWDLAHIDGAHGYEPAKHDLEICIPACRYILLDDTHMPDIEAAAMERVHVGDIHEVERCFSQCKREQRLYEVI